MKNLSGKNKLLVSIVILILIIAGFLYFAEKRTPGYLSSKKPSSQKVLSGQTKNLQCFSYTKAAQHIGEYGCVRGKVDHIYVSKKGNAFLDFCKDYRTCPFSAVIFKSQLKSFPKIKTYEGKIVSISGLIKVYQGRAEIVIDKPSQIQVR